ncbi:hypothetical protein [Flavobacterium sp.]|uniref:hypothetical protein n=1 Tax=Flavobacterium sp. TaxID=239 RepID=UPI0039E2FACD
MQNAKIRLAYRIVIDANSSLLWDQYVFEDTYHEYLMQHQLYNSKELPKPTFRELLHENEKADKLHYLVGIAAHGYIQQLQGKLHRVPDKLGRNFFPFENYQLDIVNTDIKDRSKHKIGLTFFSPVLALIDTVDDCYLVSQSLETGVGIETTMFAFQPNLAVCYYEK